MDIQTLKALGITPEQLGDRIVEQAVESLLCSIGYDEDGDQITHKTKFQREIENKIQKAVDTKIAALAEVHLIPKVGEMIERTNLRKTNQFGEGKGEPMTFIEYIASRAEAYMAEEVDIHGKSREESGNAYGWGKAGPRLTILMKLYIQQVLEQHAKAAVSDINKVIAKNLQVAAIAAIDEASKALKVSVTTK